MYKLLILFGFFIHISGEVTQGCSTASVQIKLLCVDHKLQHNLRDYLEMLQRKLLKIRLGLKEMRRFSVEVDDETHFLNPLRVYALLRHMHADWRKWLELMQSRVGGKQIRYLRNKRRKMTNSEELQRAANALLRIYEMYKLNVGDVASGLLDGKQYDAKLNALDCLHLALIQHDKQKYASASAWLEFALAKLTTVDIQIMRVQMVKLFQLQMKNLRRQNKPIEALRFLHAAMQMQPHSIELRLIQFKFIVELRNTAAWMDPRMNLIIDVNCSTKIQSFSTLLHCRYEAKKEPFLILAPFKIEELSLDPYIVLYHSVLYDNEIEHIKALSMPNLKPAAIHNLTFARMRMDETRSSLMFWLEDDISSTIKRVNRRIEHMTGFTNEDAEMLQAMKYEPGGHYVTHLDFFNETGLNEIPQFERIATVLFYLTSVPQGGATVFPLLDLMVEPRQGSALIWHNLNNRGHGHLGTYHTACPVIVGTKWVLSKWIDWGAQIFIKPCGATESLSDWESMIYKINFE